MLTEKECENALINICSSNSKVKDRKIFKQLIEEHFELIKRNEWIPFTFDENGWLNSKLPDNEEEILISGRDCVWMDTFMQDGYECWLDNSNMKFDGLAWMHLPKPYKEVEDNVV